MTIIPAPGASPDRPAPARRDTAKRRPWAFGLSLVFHGLLLLAAISSASGELMGVGVSGGDEGLMSVSLVSAAELGAEPAGGAAGELRPLLARFSNDQAPIPLEARRPTNDLARLLQRVSEHPSPAANPTDSDTPAMERSYQPSDASARPEQRAHGEGPAAPTRAPPGATGGLWGAVEPCWRDVAGRSSVAVSLEVALDAQGKLASPPKILREGRGSPNEPRLQAEARALAALAACMPRADLRFAGRTYRLDFRPDG